jgi:outer membrane immunogenic protein
MKKPATAIAAIALIGTPAFAADMAVKAPPPALEPVFSWTGFYVGAALGGEWADTTWTGTSGSSLSSIRLLSTPSPRKSD